MSGSMARELNHTLGSVFTALETLTFDEGPASMMQFFDMVVGGANGYTTESDDGLSIVSNDDDEMQNEDDFELYVSLIEHGDQDSVYDEEIEMRKLESAKFASAFRLAMEADTIEANKIIAKATSQEFVKSKKYHVVEMAWFRRASPVLAGTQCRRDEIGLMVNEPLWDPNSLLICTQFEHGVDYVVVGPNVWLLLSQKFGYDRDIQVPLIYSPGRRDARVHIQLSPSASTPLLRRFPYEKYLEDGETKEDDDTSTRKLSKLPAKLPLVLDQVEGDPCPPRTRQNPVMGGTIRVTAITRREDDPYNHMVQHMMDVISSMGSPEERTAQSVPGFNYEDVFNRSYDEDDDEASESMPPLIQRDPTPSTEDDAVGEVVQDDDDRTHASILSMESNHDDSEATTESGPPPLRRRVGERAAHAHRARRNDDDSSDEELPTLLYSRHVPDSDSSAVDSMGTDDDSNSTHSSMPTLDAVREEGSHSPRGSNRARDESSRAGGLPFPPDGGPSYRRWVAEQFPLDRLESLAVEQAGHVATLQDMFAANNSASTHSSMPPLDFGDELQQRARNVQDDIDSLGQEIANLRSRFLSRTGSHLEALRNARGGIPRVQAVPDEDTNEDLPPLVPPQYESSEEDSDDDDRPLLVGGVAPVYTSEEDSDDDRPILRERATNDDTPRLRQDANAATRHESSEEDSDDDMPRLCGGVAPIYTSEEDSDDDRPILLGRAAQALQDENSEEDSDDDMPMLRGTVANALRYENSEEDSDDDLSSDDDLPPLFNARDLYRADSSSSDDSSIPPLLPRLDSEYDSANSMEEDSSTSTHSSMPPLDHMHDDNISDEEHDESMANQVSDASSEERHWIDSSSGESSSDDDDDERILGEITAQRISILVRAALVHLQNEDPHDDDAMYL